MQPTAAIADAAVDTVDDWNRPLTDWGALLPDTPLAFQMSDDMFTRVKRHAAIEEEEPNYYLCVEVMCHVSDGEAIDDDERQQAQDPERYKAELTPNDVVWKELGIEDDDGDDYGPDKEANLDDGVDDY